MSFLFRHSICNEVYEKRPFAETCKSIRATGYTGIEISPFTLADDPATLTPAQRRECRDAIAAAGLHFVGLHWLLVSPKGLHVTTPDKALRQRSWEHLRNLVDLCADLGSGVMIFGSPKQRSSTGGMTAADATKALTEGLAWLGPHAASRKVEVLLEALPWQDTDVVTSLDEAAAIVRQVNSPGIQTMFDCHNAVNETDPHATVVDRNFDLIKHVHLNEMDGRHPSTGNYPYRALLETLARRNYQGWLSLEVFDFSAGADRIAADSLRHMESEAVGI